MELTISERHHSRELQKAIAEDQITVSSFVLKGNFPGDKKVSWIMPFFYQA